MIISISGLDGAGKTTQINKLLQYFDKINYQTTSIYHYTDDIRYHQCNDLKKFYNYFVSNEVIHTRFRMNSDENNYFMNIIEYSNFDNFFLAEATALQGYYDAIQMDKYINKPLIDMNKTLIYDRYFYDEIAFKSIFGSSYKRMIKMYHDFREPDYKFYIRVSPQVIYKRNQVRKDSTTTIYQDIFLITKLSNYFEMIAKEFGLIIIDGEKSPEKIHQIILNYIKG